ncbi:MAG: hypothetical protein RLY71_1663 [Pseudomonadota bacterium]|jgi:hypothetical protein
MNRFRRNLLLGAAMVPVVGLSVAQSATVLTVRSAGGASHKFDMAALERMAQRNIVTATPWYDRPHKFTGPLLRDVLAAAGAKGTMLKAIALNDYAVEIPVADAQKHDVIVARLLDDQPMPRREKGPLFIIYPFDEQTELRKQIYFTRCAWQLKEIEVS